MKCNIGKQYTLPAFSIWLSIHPAKVLFREIPRGLLFGHNTETGEDYLFDHQVVRK